MIIAHLSDLHVRKEGSQAAFGRFDTTAMTRAAFAKLVSLQVRPDIVVITGDLVDTGQVEEYELLREMLGDLEMPVHLALGNHDVRENFLKVFPEYGRDILPDGFVQYEAVYPELRMLVLDTLVEGEGHGGLCESRLEWLRARLATGDGKPTLLVAHHAPFRIGSVFCDAVRLTAGAEELKTIVRGYPEIQRLLCGHHHRAADCLWAGTLASIAPAVVNALDLDLDLDLGGLHPPKAIAEPPAFKLHVWLPEDGFVSHTVFVDDYGEPLEALPDPAYPALRSFLRETGTNTV